MAIVSRLDRLLMDTYFSEKNQENESDDEAGADSKRTKQSA